MRTFPFTAKMRSIDFLKPTNFQIERDSIKRNNSISIIFFIVPPKHNENVYDNNVLMVRAISRPISSIERLVNR